MINEAASLGVCKECYKREKNLKNPNNTQNISTHGKPSWDCICLPYPDDDNGGICATHIGSYANFVHRRATRCVRVQERLCITNPSLLRKNGLPKRVGRGNEAFGALLETFRGPTVCATALSLQRIARHKRTRWPSRNQDLVRSCALCTRIPGADVEPSNPRLMSVEIDAAGVHVGPGNVEIPKLIPAGRQ